MAHASAAPASSHSPQTAVGHVVPLWLLGLIAGVLLVLTFVTVWVTQFDFGPTINLLLAMVIALVKALLVALFFMHLWWDRPVNGVVFIGALFFVTIFVLFAMMDKANYAPAVDEYAVRNTPAPDVPTWETVQAEAARNSAGGDSE